MTSSRIAIGIAIEGIPGPSGALQRCIAFGGTMPTSATYEWTQGLTAIPQDFSSSSIDPFEGTWQTSAATFSVSANDDYAGLLMREDRFPALTLAGTISDTTTTILLSDIATGTTLYVGDETMRITAGSNPYTVERGAFGSTAQAHDAGTFASEHPSYWVPREIAVVYYDLEADEEWIEWRGYIDDISMVNARIELSCSEFYSRWSQARANLSPQNLNAQGTFRYRFKDRVAGSAPYVSSITSSSDDVALQMGEALMLGQWISPASGGPRFFEDASPGSTLYGGDLDVDGTPGEAFAHPVWELALWDRELDIYPTSNTGDQFHPLRICLDLLGQGTLFDQWAVKLPVDVSAFEAEIAATPGLVIDRFVLGIDGAPYRPFEKAESLMRLYGYTPSITVNGDYSIKRLKVLDIETYQRVSSAPLSAYRDLPYERSASAASGASDIQVTVGGAVPGEVAQPVTISAVGGSARAQLLTERETTNYDASFISPDKALAVATQITDSAIMIHYGLPRLRVLVADYRITGADYDLGAEVLLESLGHLATPWWVDRNGARIGDLTGRIDGVGVIVERRLRAATRTYELTLLLVAFSTGTFARERAPAAVIDSASGEVATCANTFHDDEASYFTVGDEVSLWSRDGEVVAAGPFVISAISGDDITINSATPAAGQIVRIASSSDFDNDTRYSLTNRPYTYLADANQQIDTPPGQDTDPADIYGGGLGISGTAGDLDPIDTDYIALHDDAVAPDQPVDSFVADALRSNAHWIDAHGHQVTWTPRCSSADSMVLYTGHRPYASVAESTIMHIPWIVQRGMVDMSLTLEHRTSKESGSIVGHFLRLEFDGRERSVTLVDTSSLTYTWQAREFNLLQSEIKRSERVLPLTLWQRGDVDDATTVDFDSAVSTFFLGGMYLENTGGLFAASAGTLPNATDQHPMVFLGGNTNTYSDLLYTYDIDGSNGRAITRPESIYQEFTANGELRPLGYVQVRSIQISEMFDRSADIPDDAQYLPQVTVEGRDEVGHGLHQTYTASRWRPLYVGPVGRRHGTELYPTGYGRKFEFVTGSGAAQPFFSCPISPRYPSPTIRLLAHVIGVWTDSGHETSILTPEELAEATGDASWTLTATISRYVDGSATPSLLATQSQTVTIDANPSAYTPASTFLTQEQVYEGLSTGAIASIPAAWAYKEGQLFAEDLSLVQLIDLEVDVSSLNPSTLDTPLIFKLDASCSISGFTFPDPPGGASSVLASDLRLVCVGYTVWEKN